MRKFRLTRKRKQAIIIANDALSVMASAALSIFLIIYYVHSNAVEYLSLIHI